MAAQATELAAPDRLGAGTAEALRCVREVVTTVTEDRALGPDVDRLARAVLIGDELRGRVRDAVAGRRRDAAVSPLALTYLSGADVDALGADRRRDPRRGRRRAGGAGSRRDGDRAAHASVPARRRRPLQRAARRDAAVRWGQGRRRLRLKPRARAAIRAGVAAADGPDDRGPAGDPRRDRDHRDADRGGDRDRRPSSRARRRARARSHRRPRDRLLECAADRARAAGAGDDPRALAAAGEPRGVRRPAPSRPRPPDRGHRPTGSRACAAPTWSSRPAG